MARDSYSAATAAAAVTCLIRVVCHMFAVFPSSKESRNAQDSHFDSVMGLWEDT